jgi:hypothetical protein
LGYVALETIAPRSDDPALAGEGGDPPPATPRQGKLADVQRTVTLGIRTSPLKAFGRPFVVHHVESTAAGGWDGFLDGVMRLRFQALALSPFV